MDSKKISAGALALTLGFAGLAQAADQNTDAVDTRVDVTIACDDGGDSGCNGECNGECGSGGDS